MRVAAETRIITADVARELLHEVDALLAELRERDILIAQQKREEAPK